MSWFRSHTTNVRPQAAHVAARGDDRSFDLVGHTGQRSAETLDRPGLDAAVLRHDLDGRTLQVLRGIGIDAGDDEDRPARRHQDLVLIHVIHEIEAEHLGLVLVLGRKIPSHVHGCTLSESAYLILEHLIRRVEASDAGWLEKHALVDEQRRQYFVSERWRREEDALVDQEWRKHLHKRNDHGVTEVAIEPGIH